MIIKRLLVIQAVIALGLGSVFLLPQKNSLGPAGIALWLPKDFGWWKGTDQPVAPEELAGLAPDTGFARQLYTDVSDDQVYTSIVLSGADMNNSIHRPERCLTAQGWTNVSSKTVQIPMPGGAPPLEVTALTSVREVHLKDGAPVVIRRLNYYWFIGAENVTASHLVRTLIDLRDSVLYGTSQRWAYVTVAATVTDNLKKGGLNDAETAKVVEDFIAEIVPQFQKPQAPSPVPGV